MASESFHRSVPAKLWNSSLAYSSKCRENASVISSSLALACDNRFFYQRFSNPSLIWFSPILFRGEDPTLGGRPMERVGYHTVAKLHAVQRVRTMSILSRREAPENACSPARRRCLPAPLRLLSLSPSSSFISVRKTLSQCLPTMRARRQPPAPPSILGIRMERKK